MEEHQVSMPKEGYERQTASLLYISLALEDALCDLVAAHGIGYLDTFYARRVQRMGDQLIMPAEVIASLPPEAISALSEGGRNMGRYGEDELKRICARVESDPTQVR